MSKKKNSSEQFLQNGVQRIQWSVLSFVFLILGVFPLYYQDYYFNILNAKYDFYRIAVIGLVIIIALSSLFLLIEDRVKHQGVLVKQYRQQQWLNIPDVMLLVFFTVSAISTVVSPYRYEAFWGNQGRYSGLFLFILYLVSYFIVSKNLKFHPFLVQTCVAAGILVCLFGITDYFRLDILHFKLKMTAREKDLFTATIGNINTYTAYVALIMGLAATLFISSEKRRSKIYYLICMGISFLAIIMGVSENAYLAVAALFGFLPLYAFRTKQGFKSYFMMIAVFFSCVQAIDWLNQIFAGRTVALDGIFQMMVSFDHLGLVVVGLWLLAGGIYAADSYLKEGPKYCGKTACTIWLVCLGLVIAAIIFVLIDVNINWNVERYGTLGYYLFFSDEWGTNRGYIWRVGIENYLKQPLVNRIFGSGPETFGILTSQYNKWEMNNRFNQYFDNAHNEYLQYFVTIGPLGLLSYLGFLISSGWQMVKKAGDNPYVQAIVFAIICYSAQALVNLNLPIVAPVMWTLLMTGLAAVKKESQL